MFSLLCQQIPQGDAATQLGLHLEIYHLPQLDNNRTTKFQSEYHRETMTDKSESRDGNQG